MEDACRIILSLYHYISMENVDTIQIKNKAVFVTVLCETF